MDLHLISDRRRPLHADLRHLRTALEAIDVDALGGPERDQLERWLVAARGEVCANGHRWRRAAGPPCPEALAGRRCVASPDCMCQRYRTVIDHWAVWESDGITRVTLEPYEVEMHVLAAFLHALLGMGFSGCISGSSEYAPGQTFLIDLRRGAEGVDL